jgi:hypothetical protein
MVQQALDGHWAEAVDGRLVGGYFYYDKLEA